MALKTNAMFASISKTEKMILPSKIFEANWRESSFFCRLKSAGLIACTIQLQEENIRIRGTAVAWYVKTRGSSKSLESQEILRQINLLRTIVPFEERVTVMEGCFPLKLIHYGST